jgi:hypothetical protein
MRIPLFFALVVFCPILVLADVQWHEFGRATNDVYPIKDTITIGRTILIVDTQTNADSSFPGDDLILTVRSPGKEARQYYFTSTYGFGAVAIHGDILLIKYGVGRGTGARTDHVKVLRLNRDLDELVDVQSSYYVLTDPHNAMPDLFEYRLKIQTVDGYTTLAFSLPKPQRGIPSEKIVRIKNDTQ